VARVDVHPDHPARTTGPEAARIHRGVENVDRRLAGIEPQHFFEQLGVVAVPDRR
jgi:hypothetical protein